MNDFKKWLITNKIIKLSKFHKRNYVGKAFRKLCSKFQINMSGIGWDTASESFEVQLVTYTLYDQNTTSDFNIIKNPTVMIFPPPWAAL